MADLTREYILERLTPVITKEIVKAGIEAIIKLVVEILLQRDGKYCYYCSDPSMKKFVMMIDHEGQVIKQNDSNAQGLRSILSIPLQSIVGEIYEKHTIKAIQKTYDEVGELKHDGSNFTAKLACALPRDADGLPECLRKQIKLDLNDTDELKRLEDQKQRIKSKALRKQILEESPYLAT